MDVPRRSEGGVALASAPAPALTPAIHDGPSSGGAGASGKAVVVIKQEEEETLGQLRDRLRLTPGISRAQAPGPRAAFVHIKVEDSSSGEDTDGEEDEGGGEEATTGGVGHGEEVEEREQEDEEDLAEQRDLSAHALGASLKGGGGATRPQRLPPGAPTEPGSPRARLRAPRRVADYDDGKGEGVVPELVMRGGGDRAGSSQFKGVTWNKRNNKWVAQCKKKHMGRHLGYHATEEEAALACSKYLKDGIDPVERRVATKTSHFTGVCWDKSRHSWKAKCEGKDLGHHATEAEAARAYSNYLQDGIDLVKHRDATNTSQFAGVHWNKNTST